MKKYLPLNLSSYFLNFSYGDVLNLENRIFVSIPKNGSYLEKNSKLEIINICFEMNSAFNEKTWDQENYVKILVNNQDFLIEDNRGEFKKQINKDSNINKTFLFKEEKELFLNIKNETNKFMDDSLAKKWILFCSKIAKEKNKNNFDIESEFIKFTKFTKMSRNIFNELLIDHNSIKNKNHTIQRLKDSDSATNYDDLSLIEKRYNYYILDKNLQTITTTKNKMKI